MRHSRRGIKGFNLLANSTTTKAKRLRPKRAKREGGRKRDLLKNVISTNKSFDYSMRSDYKSIYNLPPNILHTKLDYLG